MDPKDSERGLPADYWWFRAKRECIVNELKKHKITKAKILNVGCGTGEDALLFQEFGEVHSVDTNKQAIRQLPKKLRKYAKVMDVQKLKYKDKTFDVVIASDVLEHVEQDFQAAQEIHRVLKKDGLLIVTVPAWPFLYGPMDRVVHHYRRYTRSSLKRILRRFEREKMTFWNVFLSPLITVMKVLKKRSKKNSLDVRPLPRPVNTVLYITMALENLFHRINIRFPFGISLLAVARKR